MPADRLVAADVLRNTRAAQGPGQARKGRAILARGLSQRVFHQQGGVQGPPGGRAFPARADAPEGHANHRRPGRGEDPRLDDPARHPPRRRPRRNPRLAPRAGQARHHRPEPPQQRAQRTVHATSHRARRVAAGLGPGRARSAPPPGHQGSRGRPARRRASRADGTGSFLRLERAVPPPRDLQFRCLGQPGDGTVRNDKRPPAGVDHTDGPSARPGQRRGLVSPRRGCPGAGNARGQAVPAHRHGRGIRRVHHGPVAGALGTVGASGGGRGRGRAWQRSAAEYAHEV